MNMGGLSIWHWLIVGIVVMLLFGKGRFSDMMGDMAKGIKEFKKGMSDDAVDSPQPVKPVQQIDAQPVNPSASTPVNDEHKQG
jgi:sec-independent protein translocase protein TatA